MMSYGLGIVSSLIGQLCMTIGFYIWENHWRGSAFALNMLKCNVASIGFLLLTIITSYTNTTQPSIFTSNNSMDYNNNIKEDIGYLLLSSIIGIMIGDIAWLYSFQLIGAKQVIIMDCLKPFIATILGYFILNEQLHYLAMIGIIITIIGILFVSLDNIKHDIDNNSIDENGTTVENTNHSNNHDTSNPNVTRIDYDDHNDVKIALDGKYFGQDITSSAKENIDATVVTVGIKNDEENHVRDVQDEYNVEKIAVPITHDKMENHGQLASYISSVCISDGNKLIHCDEETISTVVAANTTYVGIKSTNDNMNHQFDDIANSDIKHDENNTNHSSKIIMKNNVTSIWMIGTVMSMINVILDTYSALLIKQYGIHMSIWEVNLIRFGFAGICMALISTSFILRDIIINKNKNNNNNNNVNQINNDDDHSMVSSSPLSVPPPLHSTTNIENTENEISQQSTNNVNNRTTTPLLEDSSNKINNRDVVNDNQYLKSIKISVRNEDEFLPLPHHSHDEVHSTNDVNHPITNTSSSILPWYQLPINYKNNNYGMTKKSWIRILIGTFFVTFLTPTLSYYALFQLALALALTLGSTGPIYSLFISHYIINNKRISFHNNVNILPPFCSTFGTILAVGGIILLAFRGTV